MTVAVVCGAGCPDGIAFTRSGDNKSCSPVPLRGLPAPLLDISPLFSRGQGRLRVELFTSQLSVWKRLQMLLCFSFFLLLLGAARAFARPVFKALEEKGEKEWPLNCLFLFLPRQPKVQSKQAEVNGFIFSFSVAFCVCGSRLLLFVLFPVIISIYSTALLKVTSVCPNVFHIQKHSIPVVILEFMDLFWFV